MRKDNSAILNETLAIMEKGHYDAENHRCQLQLSKEEQKEAIVLLEDEIHILRKKLTDKKNKKKEKGKFTVRNQASVEGAIELGEEGRGEAILVLNFVNPYNPGGGVRKGKNAQEEDLCRSSTLLASLESAEAGKFYDFHRKKDTFWASDSIIISPNVEILRGANGELLRKTLRISVITCAAPRLTDNLNEISVWETEKIISQRIEGILAAAYQFGYKKLVLGAWGCGDFSNDPRMVAKLFYLALEKHPFFGEVRFSVLDRTRNQSVMKCFMKYFDDSHGGELRQNV